MTSSSSNSTVRDGDKNKKRDKRARLPPPPPSPPPRKSSQKFRKDKDKSPESKRDITISGGESPGPSASPKVGPPPRPSREGTPDMQSQLFEPIPVIQSNLLPLPRERRGSEPATIRSLPGSTTSLPQINKNASTPHLPTATSDARPRTAQKQGGFNSRFLFFGRKKTPSDAETKTNRKGPVAGTGHEGYGRVGAVRRRSASKSDPKNSQDNPAGDSFLTDRVNPVVIAGGEIIENRNPSAELSRVNSNQSVPSRPSTDSKASVDNTARTTLWPSAMPRSARRPSVQRLRSPGDPLILPQPIITTTGSMSSPMTSFDTSIVSDESHNEMQRELSREGDQPKKLQKRPRSPRKWNLFSRSQRSQRPKQKSELVEAAVVPVEKKPIPFYAMMESEQEEELDVQEALRRADVYDASPVVQEQSEMAPAPQPAPAQQILLDGVSGTEAQIGKLHNVPGITRPSRLPQVGRIPQVVKLRTETQSFSRPFRASMQAPPVVIPAYDPESIAKGPTPPRPSTPILDESNAQKDPTKLSPEVTRGEREFLAFSPRKNSDVTIGTSSSSSGPSFAATAVIPKPDDPPVEDEVWDEYNDLLGDDKVPQSATSSKDPFHLETYHAKLVKDKPLESPVVPENRKEPCSKPTSSTYSADMTERIRNAFQPHPSPTAIATGAESKRTSASSGRTVFSDCSATSDDASPLAQVNLRVGSMTVSKWLTFGHVLFSDIRHELSVKDASGHSVVVIDGLGNDDWSFYAAETYPAASFYNLSPRAPLPVEVPSPTGFPLSPPNHHQVQYMSHKDKFPFAPQSFDCMVYRFPAAGSESQYRNIVNEARRVLRPGAYIEMSILDVDLNNMGNCGRRTVRRLKEHIHEETSDTSLASTADLMVRLLGRAGFTNIKAARVGVPVASSITRTESKPKDAKPKGASLADMMKDNSPMADASITKIVTRVGRWWYTRCYESAAGSASNSIWSDKALLTECEALGTSLKLMVCCARAPDRIASI
ncbi:methyltransferase type 11 [Purpureocillium lavendulum]|uniref:Methyltransferase type 11 n=1 Tax=Purpureocillium lavendulum TaxID=1247861 RepID=A0AB34FT54_9HYPO|nr:methyltransferase type 11 [Purpureocillium lavendulum]